MGFSILARLTGSPVLGRAIRACKYAWRRLYFWPLYALRKSRFTALGLDPRSPLGTARLNLGHGCNCRHKQRFATATWDNIREFNRASGSAQAARRLTPTAAVIDLDMFPAFESWRVQVSRATSGKYHRSANKARRLGYTSRLVGKDSYQRSVHELTGSKLRRSKGIIVWAAITGPPADLIDTRKPAIAPVCPRHWRQCWASFRTGESGEHLAAFAILIRAGDVIWVQRFIGHGAALTDGVTKMLMFDIMQWLLARCDPTVQGIRYMVHGYIEEGGAGLFDWKRYLGFKPMLLELADAP